MRFSEENTLASLCRESFYRFLQEFWHIIVDETPVFNWHVRYLCDELQIMAERVFRGDPKQYDLIINIPPGTTKSTICSQAFPAWCWTRMPSAKFIGCSYSYAVALKDSIRSRDLVQSELYQRCFPGITLREDENMKGLFVNTKTGFRLSAGVGGTVTGYHSHFIMVDDPINPEESFSDLELKKASRFIEVTLPTRKIDKRVTTMTIVQQRLAQNDPSGEYLEKMQSHGVKHICLPGELTDKVSPPELKAFYKDGLLDPVRLPWEVLAQMKKNLGAYGYAGQILQDPVPLGGGTFKTDMIRLVQEPPVRIVQIVRAWDKAGTFAGGAYSAGVLLCIDKNGQYGILDCVRGQWAATQREAIMLETALLDGYEVEIELEIEGGSGGKESGEASAKNLAGFRLHLTHPTGDKEARAYGFASQVGAGNVWCLDRPWTKPLLEEYRFFPFSRYKDQVDAGSAAFNRLARKRRKVGGAWGNSSLTRGQSISSLSSGRPARKLALMTSSR